MIKKLAALSILLGVLAVVAVQTLQSPTPESGRDLGAEPAPQVQHVEEGSDSLAAVPQPARDRIDRYLYDAAADHLSLTVRDVPLAEVLETISERSGLIVDVVSGLALSSPVTIQLEQVSLVQALRDLLRGFNKVFFYDPDRPEGTRLAKVLILSALPSEALRQARATLREDPRGALVDAIARNDVRAAGVLAEALREAGRESERASAFDDGIAPRDAGDGQRAVDQVVVPGGGGGALAVDESVRVAVDELLQLLDEGDVEQYAAAMRVLKEVAPQEAAVELARRLETADDGQPTILAAWGLGAVGSDDALALLAQTYESENEDLRIASAESRQQIRLRQQGTEDTTYLDRPPPVVELDEDAY